MHECRRRAAARDTWSEGQGKPAVYRQQLPDTPSDGPQPVHNNSGRIAIEGRRQSQPTLAQRYGPARLILAYAGLPILMLLLAHYLLVMKLDLHTAYLRMFSLGFPGIVGLMLFWQAGRGLGAAVLFGAAIGIISVFGMLAVVGAVDSAPIIPSSRFEWQEAIEYATVITLATVAGSAFARAISAARNAIRRY
jgi:hypothetical protein